ncbi:hypothetical protein [Paraglaciecola psychrophila]|uniref:Uncharacterized protein n=1 Tax=Paraglaciecola psychrophila 170 TaxID=1129794 RepID=K7AEJ4_9ALTE|nr:hypothetical protein [Paraglaciecola psychrophila]AGH42484.1 hypothetical protein C427_0374 [Paraglaciecola psychrophila 170]GAC40647.1 hypothetical protein GPSY_5048 [Paraglaciecola psychrophila 170]
MSKLSEDRRDNSGAGRYGLSRAQVKYYSSSYRDNGARSTYL